MTQLELKEKVYDILDKRIRPRIDPKSLANDESATTQHAVNLAISNIAILATNKNREVAIDYLYELQRKVFKGITRELVSANAYKCFGKFRTEILAFREMHKLLDESLDCGSILKRVQHILDNNAKEFDIEPGSQVTPSLMELLADGKPEDEAAFMQRASEHRKAKRKTHEG